MKVQRGKRVEKRGLYPPSLHTHTHTFPHNLPPSIPFSICSLSYFLIKFHYLSSFIFSTYRLQHLWLSSTIFHLPNTIPSDSPINQHLLSWIHASLAHLCPFPSPHSTSYLPSTSLLNRYVHFPPQMLPPVVYFQLKPWIWNHGRICWNYPNDDRWLRSYNGGRNLR